MAKLRGPLMSQNASGTIGPRMTFSNRKSGAQVRIQNAQKKKIQISTAVQKRLYDFAVARWNSYTQGEKNAYILVAKNLKMSGYNYFMKLALKNPKVYLNLIAYWSFDKIETGGIIKEHIQGIHFYLQPLYPSNAPILQNSSVVAKQPNKFIKQIKFNGTSNYATTINTRILDPKTGFFTWSGWIYFSPFTGAYRCIFVSNATGGGRGYGIRLNISANTFHFEIYGSIGVRQGFAISYIPYLNKMSKVTVVIEPILFRVHIYINGNFIVTQQLSDWGSINSQSNTYLGRYTSAVLYYNGHIDDITLYNRGLSAGEIKQLYLKDVRNT